MDLSQMLRGALPSAGELRYGFEVAGMRLVPAAGVLTEMVAEARVFPVPKAAPGLAGVINLRGTVVPLLDRRTQVREAGHIRPFVHRALVFDRDDHRVGLLLDDMPRLLALLPVDPALALAESADAGAGTSPSAGLKAFLTRPWCRVDQQGEIWWEFNHRLAFESLAHGLAPTASATAHTTAHTTAQTSRPQGIEEVIE